MNDTTFNKDRKSKQIKTQQYYNFLKILGLKDNFTISELKDAYREKISNSHPDKNSNDPDATEKTIEINAAFEFLENFINNEPKIDNESNTFQNEKEKENEKEQLIKDACELLGIQLEYTKEELKIVFAQFEIKYNDDTKNPIFKKIKAAFKLLYTLISQKEKEQKKKEKEEQEEKKNQFRNNYSNSNDDDLPKDENDWNFYANQFLKKYNLMKSKGVYYICTDHLWRPIKKEDAADYAADLHPICNMKNRLEIVSKTGTKRKIEPTPIWDSTLLEEEIAINGNILNILTKQIRPIEDSDYLTSQIPHKYDPNAKCPLWNKCLNMWLSENQILALQEFFGYILSGKINFKKSLLLFGESGTGKTRPYLIAKYMVGDHNCCSIDPMRMENASVLAEINGKKLNLVDDLDEYSKLGGGFRALIEGTSVGINPKFLPRIMITPIAKHIFTTNVLPRTSTNNTVTNANIKRLLIIEFLNSIKGGDQNIHTKLYEEIQGIINWSIDGLKRLLINREFTEVKNSDGLLENYKLQNADDLDIFVHKKNLFEFDPTYTVDRDLFIQHFHHDLAKPPLLPPTKWANNYTIGRKMSALGFSVERRGKEKKSYFIGLKFIEENPQLENPNLKKETQREVGF